MTTLLRRRSARWLGCSVVALFSFGFELTTRPAPAEPPQTTATFTDREPTRAAASHAPSDNELLTVGPFTLPLVPLGETSQAENLSLLRAIRAYEAAVASSGSRDTVAALTEFLDMHPQSAWRAALRVNLGTIQRQTGHLSNALSDWRTAWALTAQREDALGHTVGDAALAQLSQMLAYLGRRDELAALLDATRGRVVLGSAAELLSESARGLAEMDRTPAVSFKCGAYALTRILREQSHPSEAALELLRAARSTPRGLSLQAVHALSARAGLGLQMAFRSPGATVVMPAVLHWKLGHFAAISAVERGRYRIGDATFGEDIRVSAATLDAEASGYVLVPQGVLPKGYRRVSATEGARVWGRGNTGANKDNGATGPDDSEWIPGEEEVLSCEGCAKWSVEPMVVSLALHDVPVGYEPALGPSLRFDVHYSQRDVLQPQVLNYGNLGRKWTTSWLSHVTDNRDLNGTVELYRRGGGNETFQFSAGQNVSQPGPFSQTEITRQSDASGKTAGFTRRYANGALEQFGYALGNKFFMTALSDRYGNSVQIEYDERARIRSLTDALGQVTTLAYEDPSDPLKLSSVRDPFGRSAQFTYNEAGNLASITDTLGITSKFSYGVGDFINALETPYGTTRFTYADSMTDPQLGTTRLLETVDALGRKSRVEFRHEAPGMTASADQASVPQDMQVKNDLLQWRNTFLWSPAQYAEATQNGGLDYAKARVIHWLHTQDNSTARVIESEQAPLQARTYYNYPGQKEPIYVGSSDRPVAVGRVVGRTTQRYSYEYDALGRTTKRIDPVGRELTFAYDERSGDLLTVTNTTQGRAERLSSLTYDDKHRPLSMVGPDGATKRYAYDARGLLTKLTDAAGGTLAYTYDAKAQLLSVEGPGLANRRTLTRDAVGRVASTTDAQGRKSSYEYDTADRVTRVVYPDGTETTLDYNRLDLAKVTDRLGRSTELHWDAERQLTELVDPQGHAVQLGYDADGELGSIRDANGQTTLFERDLAGQVVSKQAADGSVARFSYDAAGRLLRVTDARKQGVAYTYNADDSVARIEYPDARIRTPSVSYEYDPAYLRLVKMIDGVGETSFAYHPLATGAGRLQEVSSPIAGAEAVRSSVSYEYDTRGQVTQESVDGEKQVTRYDEAGRVTAISNPLDAFKFEYADSSRRVKARRAEHGPALSFSYGDAASGGLLTEIEATKTNGKPLARFTYSYQENGNVSSFIESYLGKELEQAQAAPTPARIDAERGPRAADWLLLLVGSTLVLALAARRTRRHASAAGLLLLITFCSDVKLPVQHAEARSTRYTYDDSGHLRAALVESSTQTKPMTFGYSYDPASNLTKIATRAQTRTLGYDVTNALDTGRYDENGSPEQLDDSQYSWDGEDRLVRVVRGEHTTDLSYDGMSRVIRIVDAQAGKVTADHAYLYCGIRRCLERDNLRDGAPISKRYYDQGFVAEGESFYYVTDRLGSPRQIVDARGAVRAQYDYDAYGNTTAQRGDASFELGYGGLFKHASTGLLFGLYRAYDSQHGRWLNRDPLAEGGGHPNLYSYVGGDPVNWIDPLGTDAVYINYDYYPIDTGMGFHLPLGHAAVISIDPKTGQTRYYEYGRYDKAKLGEVHRRPVPNVKIGPDGAPTQASLDKLYNYVSTHYGKSSAVSPDYYADADAKKVNDFAEKRMHDAARDPYSLLSNNCKTFAQEAIDQAR